MILFNLFLKKNQRKDKLLKDEYITTEEVTIYQDDEFEEYENSDKEINKNDKKNKPNKIIKSYEQIKNLFFPKSANKKTSGIISCQTIDITTRSNNPRTNSNTCYNKNSINSSGTSKISKTPKRIKNIISERNINLNLYMKNNSNSNIINNLNFVKNLKAKTTVLVDDNKKFENFDLEKMKYNYIKD